MNEKRSLYNRGNLSLEQFPICRSVVVNKLLKEEKRMRKDEKIFRHATVHVQHWQL